MTETLSCAPEPQRVVWIRTQVRRRGSPAQIGTPRSLTRISKTVFRAVGFLERGMEVALDEIDIPERGDERRDETRIRRRLGHIQLAEEPALAQPLGHAGRGKRRKRAAY